MAESCIKRFYKDVSVNESDDGFQILLEGRLAKSPAKNNLVIANKKFADLIAAEWSAQEDIIDLKNMLCTRLAMSAIDLNESDHKKIIDLVISYLGSDLLCYFSEGPAPLRERQEQAWRPFLNWAAKRGFPLKTSEGIAPVTQTETSLAVARQNIVKADHQTVVILGRLTELSGSAVLALHLWLEGSDPDAAFSVSRIDEDYQAEKWGIDSEAEVRASQLKNDFGKTANILSLLNDR